MFFAPSPSEPGGAQQRTRLLADALGGRGWHVRVIGRSVGGWWFSRRRRGNVHVLEVPGFGSPRLGGLLFLATAMVLGITGGIRSRGFLALQLSSPATAAALCAALARRPFLVLSSMSGLFSEATLLREGRAATLRRSLLRRAVAIVGQSEAAAVELRGVLPSSHVAVLPNPVTAVGPGPLSGAPRVAFAGRLAEEKDLPLLLSAWDTIIRDRPDARLTLIGAGGVHRSVEAALRKTVAQEARLRATVRFTGWLDDPRPELLTSDVFAFPSRSEGMSNALLEACVLGRVVVASDIAANVAVLGSDYPLLFKVGGQAELVRALATALDDSDVRARCRAQIAQRMHRFEPAVIAERLEALLLGCPDVA